MNDLVERAKKFAAAAHESIDQRRKYTGAPYIVHPEAVSKTVESVTDDPEMIAAAWLHDVVEDTPISIEEIQEEFGATVAALVDDLTDVAEKSDGNRATRKAIYRAHTAKADPRAKTVKLADIIDNVSDIMRNNRGFARIYVREKVLLLEVLKEGNQKLYEQAQELITNCCKELDIDD